MTNKQSTFLLGAISGIIFGAFLLFVGFNTVNSRATEEGRTYNVDVYSVVDQAITQASPNVVGVINIRASKETGTGSGVIYKLTEKEAYIVTNHHVVNKADEVEVAFKDERREKAEVVGYDMLTDLAVIKIPRKEIGQTMGFANSDQLRVGEFVFAIGNPLGLDLYGSATLGIVSSDLRLIPVDVNKDGEDDYVASVIQTDAAINPGNSGGALVNVDGKLVGINSMKIAGAQIEGIGFAIPSNLVFQITKDLERYGMVIRPYLGMHIVSVEKIKEEDKKSYNVTSEYGVYVNDVTANAAAALAGIQVNDVIVSVNNERVEDVREFRFKLYEYEIGDEITLSIIRGGVVKAITVKLESKNPTS